MDLGLNPLVSMGQTYEVLDKVPEVEQPSQSSPAAEGKTESSHDRATVPSHTIAAGSVHEDRKSSKMALKSSNRPTMKIISEESEEVPNQGQLIDAVCYSLCSALMQLVSAS